MENIDWGAVAVSLIVFLLGLRYTHASLMIQIREMISSARKDYLDRVSFEGQYSEILKKAAIEDLYNAYEEACSCYLHWQVWRPHFKSMYKNEIKNNVEDELYTGDFKEPNCSYPCIAKVYKKWFPNGVLKE